MRATKRWLAGRRRAAAWSAALMAGILLSGCGGASLPKADLPAANSPPAWSGRNEPIPRRPLPVPPDPVPVRTLRVGQSESGRELTVTLFGSGERPVLLFGAIHGDEPAGATLARRLMEELRRDGASCRACPVAILPAANPDGLAAGKRANAHGVDLNRNFPARNWRKAPPGTSYGGPAPASERETQAILRAVEQLQPRLILAIHAIGHGRQCNNYDGPAAAVGRLMSSHNGYPVKASIGYPTPGSLGSWAGVDRQIPVITLELPAGQSSEDCWTQNREALLAAIAKNGL